MSFARPALAQLATRIQADIESRLPAAEPRLRTELAKVLSAMEAGVAHGLYGYLDYLARNLLPGSTDEAFLSEWAGIYKVPRLTESAAAGPAEIPGTEGSILPAATLLQSSSGVQYTVVADAAVVDGVAAFDVIAVDSGVAGNLPPGDTVSLLASVPGIQAQAVVTGTGLTGGADIETLQRWSERLLQRIQNPPHGGTLDDYERWARAAHPAVTHVWPTAHEGGAIGTVTVRVATFDDPAGDLPAVEGAVVQAVTDYTNARRPVAGKLHVLPPVAQPVDMTLAISPDTVAIRQRAEAALHELFRRSARPGYFQPGNPDLLGGIPLTHVHEALSLVEDEHDHQIQSIDALAPAMPGMLLTLGAITWAAWQV